MANYLKDLVKKAKRIKTEEDTIKPKEKKPVINEEEVRKKLVLEKRKKEKLRKTALEEELMKKVPPKKEAEEKAEEEKREVSTVDLELESMDKKEIDSYGEVKIYNVPGKILPYYVVPVTKPTLGERTIINTIKEAATRLISIAPYRIRDPEQRRTVYKQKIIEILQASSELNIPERRYNFYAESVVREMVGYGLIDSLIRDDRLEEIMVIGSKKPVYVFHREHEMMVTNIEFFDDSEIVDLINRIAREVGRRVDISAPLLDARLADGSRVNATIPPASISGSSLTIRKFREDPYSIIDLIKYETFDVKSAAFMWLCVDGLGVKPANILITGGTGSGKTTTLNVLASFIPERERIVTIEDTAELNLPLRHVISLESRPPGLEGTGELTLDILTKNSLRMRPDRVIVGEVRHDEAFTLFTAMNTGHDGMASPDTLIQLADGVIQPLGEFCDAYLKTDKTKKINDLEMMELTDKKPEIVTINKQDLSQNTAKVNAVWKRECKKSFSLKMASGKEIKLSYDHPVFRLKDGFLEQVQCHECKTGDFLCTINSINLKGKIFNEKYAYFIGLLLGDGHLGKRSVCFENKNEKLHEIFKKLSKKLFKKEIKLYKRKDGRMSSMIHSTELVNRIHKEFGIPVGNKTKIFDIPKKIEKSNNYSIAFFLRGMFDSDGHTSKIRKSVVLATSNLKVSKKIPILLKRFGIESRLNIQEKDGRNNYGPYYRIFITGEGNLKRFKENIGFNHPKKMKTLKLIVGVKENTNVDVIPKISPLISMARKVLGISQKELSLKAGFGKTRTAINAYETNARNPSRESLKRINKVLINEFNKKIKKFKKLKPEKLAENIRKSSSEKAIRISMDLAKEIYSVEKLQQKSGLKNKILYYNIKKGKLEDKKREKLINAILEMHKEKTMELIGVRQLFTHINSITSKNIRWDKIVKIEEKDEKTYYYDLTLDKFNTFVANGLIISNCLGTIHANSPQETLVRVTSPPMNVPEVMLSGLDLIVVEHRIHDKKKGTIRRITEIAEVTGVLQNKTSTQTLFERDALRDKLIKSNAESGFIKNLMKFTGYNAKQIEKELNDREKLLEKLIKKETHDMKEVVEAMRDFLNERQ